MTQPSTTTRKQGVPRCTCTRGRAITRGLRREYEVLPLPGRGIRCRSQMAMSGPPGDANAQVGTPTGHPQRIADQMANFGIEALVFAGVHVEPTDASFEAVIRDYVRENPDAVKLVIAA